MSANLLARASYVFGLAVWVIFVFIVSELVVGIVFGMLQQSIPLLDSLNDAIVSTLLAALVYGLSIALLVATPYAVRTTRKVTLRVLGLQRTLSWSDIGIGILAALPYFILSGLLVAGISAIWSGFDTNQTQAIPFSNLHQRYEVLVAFATLVIIAPIAEETLFRGYLLGKMKERIHQWVAVFVTALVFGSLHLLGSDIQHLQYAVAADTFALGIVLGSLRIITGSIWAGILLHMLKNFLAFYLLFIYPTMGGTM